MAVAAVVVLTCPALPAVAQFGIILKEFDRIRALDGAVADEFGFSVGISGDLAVVGSPLDDDNGSNSGSVYVFARNASGAWLTEFKLLASDGAAGDGFGAAVAISGDTVVVGALLDGDNGANSGSAYIFVRNASGIWAQQAKLLPFDGAAGDFFGDSVAIAGDTTIVGAQGDDAIGADSGSAYVFVRDAAGVWTQQAKLLPTDGAAHDNFGASIAFDSSTMVGAPLINGSSGAVAFNINRAIIGAPQDDDNGTDSGSAYVFLRDTTGAWTQQAKLLAFDGAIDDEFGASLSINGDTVIVGAPFDDDRGNASGSAYIFMSDAAGVWTQDAKLLALDGALFDQFGHSVAVSGNVAVVGAWLDNDNGLDSGSAYLFTRGSTGLWVQEAKLKASDGNAGDEFGFSVAQHGDRIFIGAPFDDNNGTDSGSTYVFDLSIPGSVDLNSDGRVNIADLSILFFSWGGTGLADFNVDSRVDGIDLAILLSNWGVVPAPPPPPPI